MRAKKNPSSNNVVLLAAGGFALYYFWPQISAAMSGSSTAAASDGSVLYPSSGAGFTTQEPNLTDAQLAVLLALENQGYPASAATAAAAGAAGSSSTTTTPITTASLQPAFSGAVVPAGTTYVPGQPLPPGVSLPGNQVNIVAAQPLQNPNIVSSSITSVRAQNPGIDPASLLPRGTTPALQMPAPTATASSGGGLPVRTVPTNLSGTKRLRGLSSEATRAALLVQAKLNNSVSYDAPQVTNNSPVGPWTPGAAQVPGGCWSFGDTPVLLNCAGGSVPATPGAPANGNCMPGYTMSDNGQCAKVDDQVILAQLNSTPYVAGTTVSLNGVSNAILGLYVTTIGVNPGSQLAAYLGLPANQAFGTFAPGNDGFNYLMLQGIFVRQGTQTQLTRPTGPIGPRPAPLPNGTKLKGILPSAVPITNATLVAASSDPKIAATLGNDPRGMLTVEQWNYYYTQSTGVLQMAPPYPATDPNALMTAQQYQQWRIRAGLTPAPPKKTKLGVILNSRPGAFPLGGISNGPIRRPFVTPGNNNIYRIPGRGAVYAAKRLGVILDGGGNHRWAQSPFPRPSWWRQPEA